MKKIILASILGLSSITSAFAGDVSLENDTTLYAPITYESVKFTVYFKAGSSELSQANIDALGPKIMSYNPSKVYIVGKSSPEGKSSKNLELSKERVESVKDYLVIQGLNSDSILSAEALGDSSLYVLKKPKCAEPTTEEQILKLNILKQTNLTLII